MVKGTVFGECNWDTKTNHHPSTMPENETQAEYESKSTAVVTNPNGIREMPKPSKATAFTTEHSLLRCRMYLFPQAAAERSAERSLHDNSDIPGPRHRELIFSVFTVRHAVNPCTYAWYGDSYAENRSIAHKQTDMCKLPRSGGELLIRRWNMAHSQLKISDKAFPRRSQSKKSLGPGIRQKRRPPLGIQGFGGGGGRSTTRRFENPKDCMCMLRTIQALWYARYLKAEALGCVQTSEKTLRLLCSRQPALPGTPCSETQASGASGRPRTSNRSITPKVQKLLWRDQNPAFRAAQGFFWAWRSYRL